ncbi:membrane protein [Sphingomonas sp. DBB INV C78]|uniref:DUF924 family protein n=1 Tax=Sphingomonas sp. DBB INV C78 TaxID=3349434 RepID=UPI0036D3A6CB
MARDLGTRTAEVHKEAIEKQAEEVLHFWFVETPAAKRFAKDDALDAEIAARFGSLIDEIAGCHAAIWRAQPRTLLAAILVLDQFSRNTRRGRADAFANDPLARALTNEAICKGWDEGFSAEELQFLYMPLMHCERLDEQLRSLDLFDDVTEESATYARLHCEQIARFGRFPGRNDALGRKSTVAETDLLKAPGAGF